MICEEVPTAEQFSCKVNKAIVLEEAVVLKLKTDQIRMGATYSKGMVD
jgi:hypothetical protein